MVAMVLAYVSTAQTRSHQLGRAMYTGRPQMHAVIAMGVIDHNLTSCHLLLLLEEVPTWC